MRHTLKLIFLGSFVIFGMSFSHATYTDSMEMMEQSEHFNAAQCQTFCNLSISDLKENKPVQFVIQDKEPLLAYRKVLSLGALLLFLFFTINKLYLSSSWRPPNLVLLNGLYRSGL